MRTNDALVCMNDLRDTQQVSWLMRMNDAFVRTNAALVRTNDALVRTKGWHGGPVKMEKNCTQVVARGSWDPGS
jgi:hypothetical protein